MTLYEINEEFRQLEEMLEDGEIDDAVFSDTREALIGDLENKLESYGCVIRELTLKTEAIKSEVERLASKKSAIENNISRLRAAVKEAMEITGNTKVKTNLFSFVIQNNQASVFIPDETKVPEQYLIPQPPKVDKTAIKEWLKEGNTADWAELTQGRSLRIQ